MPHLGKPCTQSNSSGLTEHKKKFSFLWQWSRNVVIFVNTSKYYACQILDSLTSPVFYCNHLHATPSFTVTSTGLPLASKLLSQPWSPMQIRRSRHARTSWAHCQYSSPTWGWIPSPIPWFQREGNPCAGAKREGPCALSEDALQLHSCHVL